MQRRLRLVAALLAATAVGTGCGVQIPADPDGTLERVRGGVLRVGVSPAPPWTSAGVGGEPDGVEISLVRDFADSIEADVEWEDGGEEHLVASMERGELDLVVGGVTAKTPWAKQAAVTRPYVTVTGPDGEPAEHVMLAPLGENAFLVALERFLLSQDVPL